MQSNHTFHGAAQVLLSEGIVATACIVLVHHIGPASAIARELLGGVDGGAVRLARRRVRHALAAMIATPLAPAILFVG